MKTYYQNINNFIADTQVSEELPFEQRYERFLSAISKERAAHILTVKMERDRLRSMAATLLLTNAVRELAPSLPYALSKIEFPLVFAYEDNGKPYLRDRKELHFSMSHSGDYAALALADSGECRSIGMDLQETARHDRTMSISKRFYSTSEQDFLNAAQDPEEKKSIFYQIWTAKEAYIKATGLGLRQPLPSFSADLEGGHITDSETGRILAAIEPVPCPDGYAACICKMS